MVRKNGGNVSDSTTIKCQNYKSCMVNQNVDNCEDCLAEIERLEFKEKLRSLGFGKVPGGYKDRNG